MLSSAAWERSSLRLTGCGRGKSYPCGVAVSSPLYFGEPCVPVLPTNGAGSGVDALLRGGGGCAKNESGVSPCFGGYPFGGCGYRPFSSHPAGVGERCDLYILAGGVPLLWRRVLLRGRLSPAEGVGNGLTHCAGGYPFGGGIHGRPLCAGVSPTVLGIKKGSTVCTP